MAGLVSKEMVQSMADRPIVFALANPDPEISYADAKSARPDVIIATGRSDCPNQVNNVLGFPFIFRGVLDVRARKIDSGMKVAAAQMCIRDRATKASASPERTIIAPKALGWPSCSRASRSVTPLRARCSWRAAA